MRRRIFLLLVVLLVVGVAAAGPQPRSLTILHTNDLHARLSPDAERRGGFAHLAAAIRRERANADGVLVLDAGDLIQGTPVSTIYRGAPIFEIANLLGFDASTLGNHEFDYGWERIAEFRRIASFPVVGANVTDAEGRLLADAPYVIREVNGIRVAIVGALTVQLDRLTTPANIGPWRVAPVVETVRQRVGEVREKADLIVVLGHITEAEEDALLEQVPEVSVVVSGHRHSGLKRPKRLEGRLVVRARAYGLELGRLDLQVDVPEKRLVSWDWKPIPIDATAIPAAADVAAAVAQWESEVSGIVDVPIGVSRTKFTRRELRNLVARAMIDELGADLAFIDDGELRDVLPEGQLLARHVWNVMPFDDLAVVGRIRGRDLPGFLSAGRSIEPDREYAVAVTDFTSTMRTELVSSGAVFHAEGILLRDLIIAWIRKRNALDRSDARPPVGSPHDPATPR